MEIVGYIATGVFAFCGSIWTFVWLVSYFQKKQGPKLAGTVISELGVGIDLSKRYDIVYTGDFGSHFAERLSGVMIIGYIGAEDEESIGKMYMRSRWLVLSFRDGRKAYLMPHAILSLQESLAADGDAEAITIRTEPGDDG